MNFVSFSRQNGGTVSSAGGKGLEGTVAQTDNKMLEVYSEELSEVCRLVLVRGDVKMSFSAWES